VLTLPWFFWNWSKFGTLVQTSAAAQWFLVHHDLSLVQAIRAGLSETRHLLRGLVGCSGLGWGLPILLVATFFSVVSGKRGESGVRTYSSMRISVKYLFLAFTALAAYYLIHAGIRLRVRVWYLTPMTLFWCVVCGVAFDHWARRIGALKNLTRSLLAFLIVIFVLNYQVYKVIEKFRPGYNRSTHVVMKQCTEWTNENISDPPDVKLGAFNSGVIGYFSQRPVVNLDGIVNPDVLSAHRQSRLLPYCCSKGIRYLVDMKYVLDKWLRPYRNEGIVFPLRLATSDQYVTEFQVLDLSDYCSSLGY
jgi:hypothetical protein